MSTRGREGGREGEKEGGREYRREYRRKGVHEGGREGAHDRICEIGTLRLVFREFCKVRGVVKSQISQRHTSPRCGVRVSVRGVRVGIAGAPIRACCR